MKHYVSILLMAAFVCGCSCNDRQEENYDCYDSFMVSDIEESAPAEYYYEDFTTIDSDRPKPTKNIEPSDVYTQIGRWKIVDGYNIIIWSDSCRFYCCAEVDGKKDLPGYSMHHYINSDGEDTFCFIDPDDGSETYSITYHGFLRVIDRYSGDESTYIPNRL